MVANLPVVIDPSPRAIGDAILHDRISTRCSSPARLEASRHVSSAPVVSACIPQLTTLLFLALERSARTRPPEPVAHAVPSLRLDAWSGEPRSYGALGGSGSSHGSAFPSISE